MGKESIVARYATGVPGFTAENQTPYAEVRLRSKNKLTGFKFVRIQLWMGTHPSKPCSKMHTSTLLIDILKANPSLLGDRVHSHYGDDLPFLFKVLAIGKALSVQAHPDKKLAQKLHKEKPDVYKGRYLGAPAITGTECYCGGCRRKSQGIANATVVKIHILNNALQPEMAIALSQFSGFCGFRPLHEIAQYLESFPEFAAVVGEAGSAFTKAVKSEPKDVTTRSTDAKSSPNLSSVLKNLFSALMNADPEQSVKPQVQALVARLQREKGASSSNDLKSGSLDELIIRLNEQFPNDVGIFCAFMLNVVSLEPGQAVFLRANEPHAYLQGGASCTILYITFRVITAAYTDIMECMATSGRVPALCHD